MKITLFIFLLFTSSHTFSATKLSKQTFDRIITIMQTTFAPLAETNGRKLEFLTDYKSDWAQSFARRWEADQVIVYGGIAAIKNVTEDVFALGMCHELGHLYGGAPWSDDFNHLSVEGQADYWSANCFKDVVDKLTVRSESPEDRLIQAALVLTAFYADNRGLAHPNVETPDMGRVDQTLRVHPSPQCRLDSIVLGSNDEPRPSCWFYSAGVENALM